MDDSSPSTAILMRRIPRHKLPHRQWWAPALDERPYAYLAEREAGRLEPVIVKRRFGRDKVDPRRPVHLYEVSQAPFAFDLELGSALSADEVLLRPRLTGQATVARPTRFVEAIGQDHAIWLVDDLRVVLATAVDGEVQHQLRRQPTTALEHEAELDRLVETLRPELEPALAGLGLELIGPPRLRCPRAEDAAIAAEEERALRGALADVTMREELAAKQSAAEAEDALRQMAHEMLLREQVRRQESGEALGSGSVARRVERLLGVDGPPPAESEATARDELDLRLLLDALSYEVAEERLRGAVGSRRVLGLVSLTAERAGQLVEAFVGLLVLIAIGQEVYGVVSSMSAGDVPLEIGTSGLVVATVLLLFWLFRRWMAARDRKVCHDYACGRIAEAESEARRHNVERIARAIANVKLARKELLQRRDAPSERLEPVQKLLADLQRTQKALAASSYGPALDRRTDTPRSTEVEALATAELATFASVDDLVAMSQDLREQVLHGSLDAIDETMTGLRASLAALDDTIDQRRRLL